MSKIKSFTGGYVCETGQEGYHCYEERIYKPKEASFIPSSIKKVLKYLTQRYGWNVALHSVCSEIKKGN